MGWEKGKRVLFELPPPLQQRNELEKGFTGHPLHDDGDVFWGGHLLVELVDVAPAGAEVESGEEKSIFPA